MIETNQPRILVLPIIDDCQARCVMCGIWNRPSRPALTLDLVADVLAESYFSSSLTHLNITGGEPILHDGLLPITQTFCQCCPSLKEINLSTSGLNPHHCIPVLLEWEKCVPQHINTLITLSLDGMETIHNAVRRVPGAFKQTIQTLSTLKNPLSRQSRTHLHINFTLSPSNFMDLSKIREFCQCEGIPLTITLAASNDLYLGNAKHYDPFHEPDGCASDFIQAIHSLGEDETLPPADRLFFGMVSTMLHGEPRPFSCPFQTQGVFWDLDGTCYPCGTAARLPYGRFGHKPVESIFTNSNAEKIRTQLKEEYCPTCFSNSYFGFVPDVWLKILKERRAGSGCHAQ